MKISWHLRICNDIGRHDFHSRVLKKPQMQRITINFFFRIKWINVRKREKFFDNWLFASFSYSVNVFKITLNWKRLNAFIFVTLPSCQSLSSVVFFFFFLQHPCLDIFFFIYHQESVQDSFYFLKAVFVTVSDILNWLQQKLWFLRVISFPLSSSGSLNSSCVDNILCSIESEIFTIFSLSSWNCSYFKIGFCNLILLFF